MFRSQKVLLALFLLYQTSALYLIGGNNFKTLVLVFSTIIVLSAGISAIKLTLHNLIISTFFIALILIFHLNNAEPINGSVFQQYIFIFLNFAFFVTGNSRSSNWFGSDFSKFQWISILFLFIFSNSILFWEYEFGKSVIQDRHLGEEGVLNAIGIAHTRVVGIILLISISKRLNMSTKFFKLLWTLALTTSIIVLFKTGSRGPLILGGIILLIFYFPTRFLKLFKFSILFVVIAIISIKLNLVDRLNLNFARFEDLSFTKRMTDRSSLERLEMYRFAWENKSALIFGLTDYAPYPHNVFIEGFFRGGFFFWPIFLLLFIATRKAFLMRNNKDDLVRFYAAAYLYLFFQSFISLSLDNNRGLWLFLGIILSERIYKINNLNRKVKKI